jgi:hypothetical protein
VALLALTLPLSASGAVTVGAGGGTPGTSQSFQLVGANPLFGRGMNAALTARTPVGSETRAEVSHPVRTLTRESSSLT